MATYKAEYENDEIEVFEAENDFDAKIEAWSMEDENGIVFNMHEVDSNYDEVRQIL